MTDKTVITSIAEVFHRKSERLGLRIVAGERGLSREMALLDSAIVNVNIVGYLDDQKSLAVQITNPEIHKDLLSNEKKWKDSITTLFKQKRIIVFIIADDLPVPEWLVSLGDLHNICVYQSSVSHSMLFERLQHRTARKLVKKTSLHGVLLSIKNVGTLVTGPSGIGKSELALDLLNRGHRLVADDVVQVYRSSPYKVSGYCPEILRGHLEIRGLGILNVASIFGNTSILDTLPIDLIIRLEHKDLNPEVEHNRLIPRISNFEILSTSIPEVTLMVAPGRNLATLAEAAVRTHIEYQFGKDPVREFIESQKKLIERRDTLLSKYRKDS